MKKIIALSAALLSAMPCETQALSSINGKLYAAARAGDTQTIEYYLNQGYSIDDRDDRGNTALCIASWDYNSYAYDLLLSYGANPNAECMRTGEEKVLPAVTDYDGYLIAGGVALAAGGLLALSGGKGHGDDADEPEPEPTPEPADTGVFGNDNEFNAKDFELFNATKFLPAINAGTAYNQFYSKDENGNIINNLTGTSTVGIVDTGVYGAHSEFSDGAGGSKVSGYNFDYGPCNGSDRKNCWLFQHDETSGVYSLTFLNNEGNEGTRYLLEPGEYEEWANGYPDDYDWDTYKDREDSYFPIDNEGSQLTDASYNHGTHVAGIIGASHNSEGMMGVAFDNTNIKAVRWDLISSLYEPVKTLVDDNVLAINFSIGSDAGEESSSYDYGDTSLKMLDGWKEAAAYTISKYDTTGEYKDGTIWVKAAGNESYEYPDLESGIKWIDEYSDLMMLVVVSVDVTLNEDGTLNTYTKASYSNMCGNTSGYCISAPGSNIVSTDIGSGYVAMDGTSMATPVVTGAIAFLKNAFPSLRSEQIIELLMNTANKNAADYNHSTYGAGLIDLGAAASYQSPVEGTDDVVTVTGNNLNSSYVRLDNASMIVSSTLAEALKRALPENITAFDAYDRPFNYPTSTYFRTAHSGYKNLKNDVAHIIPSRKKHDEWKNGIHFAYASGGTYAKPLNYMLSEYKNGRHTSGLYFSENTRYQNKSGKSADMSNPFMSFNSAYGVTHEYNLNPALSFNFELSGGENGLYDGDNDYNDGKFKKAAYGFNSGLDYHYGKKLKFGVSGGMLHENDALLGTNGENAFSLSGGETYHFGVNATWEFLKKWSLSGSYYQGYTKAQSINSGLIKTSDLVSSGFAADLNYKHNDSTNMGIRFSSPLRIERGSVSVDFASGRDVETDTVYRNHYTANLKPKHREYKLSLYGGKDLNEDISLNGEVGIRFNPEHSDAANDCRALLGLSWNF